MINNYNPKSFIINIRIVEEFKVGREEKDLKMKFV
ncbi:hypothetical protein SJAV_21240 [Sulfurisphaera javensis]|uniref:Uncharacterized protein n=1 Tax=Sulfurisphaera javensis TaxID=2049879 RepID=A0AAT9GTP8_9CREN